MEKYRSKYSYDIKNFVNPPANAWMNYLIIYI